MLGAIGLLGAVPGAPVSPRALPAEPAGLLAVALVFALGWFWLRPAVLRALRADGVERSEPGAGVIIVLVATAVAVVMWISNPYAAALLVPALHVWLFALSPDLRMRPAVRLTLAALGVVPVAIVLVALARSLGLGAIDAAWELLLLTAGGHISLASVALWSIVAGCTVSALLVAAARRGRRWPTTTFRSPCAARAATPGRARSAAPNRRCDDDARVACCAASRRCSSSPARSCCSTPA